MSSFLSESTDSLFRENERQSKWHYVWAKVFSYRYLIYIALLFPVFLFRDFTPANELKYMSIIEEALNNNTWFTFYNHGEVYADKPPLFFWFAMLSRIITGGYYIELVGLLSLLPMLGTLAVMSKWMKEFNVSFNPLVSELLLLTTAMFMGASLIIRMDMLMTFFIVLSLYTFFKIYANKGTRFDAMLLPVCIFLAVFSKGPMGLLVPLVSIIAFLLIKGKLSTFSRYLGWKQWGIIFALFALWFMAVYIEGGNVYLNDLVFKQTVGRGVNSYKHKESFWYYFPRMLVTFAPWALLYIVLIWQGVRKKVIKGNVRVFLITVICSNVLLLSLISSKIEIYMLPIYPFVVYLASSLFSKFAKTAAIKVAIAIPVGVAILAFPVSFLLVDKIPYEYSTLMAARLGLFLLMIGGIVASTLLYKKQEKEAILTLSFGILGTFFLASFALPQFNKYIGFSEMATEAVRVAEKEGISNYAYYKFSTAPNMDVYLGDGVEKIESLNELDSFMQSGVKSILFVRETEMRRDPEFAKKLQTHRLVWHAGRYRWYILNEHNTATTFAPHKDEKQLVID